MQVNAVTSAMLLFVMASNPIAQQAEIDLGIDLMWGTRALAALVPGLLSLVAVPWVMSKMYGPMITKTLEAPAYARKELAAMGRMSRGDLVMTGTFLLLLVLWVLGSALGVIGNLFGAITHYESGPAGQTWTRTRR